MTRQITVKLNHERYRSVLDELKKFGNNVFSTDSELAGFALWRLYCSCYEKQPDGNTTFEHFCSASGKDGKQVMFDQIQKFREFNKTGKPL